MRTRQRTKVCVHIKLLKCDWDRVFLAFQNQLQCQFSKLACLEVMMRRFLCEKISLKEISFIPCPLK